MSGKKKNVSRFSSFFYEAADGSQARCSIVTVHRLADEGEEDAPFTQPRARPVFVAAISAAPVRRAPVILLFALGVDESSSGAL
jgi:hypothetical protein